MANLTSDLVATQAASALSLASGHVNGEFLGGIILHAICVLDVADAAADDTFELTPAGYSGMILLPERSYVTANQDPGTTLTVDIGDPGDTDRYSDGLVLSAAVAGTPICIAGSPTLPAGLLTRYRFTAATAITGIIVSANTITAGTKLVFDLAFLAKA